jgi:hypothetical protein
MHVFYTGPGAFCILHPLTYLQLYITARVRPSSTPTSAWRVVELLVVATPASASRRALSTTWRLAEVLLVATHQPHDVVMSGTWRLVEVLVLWRRAEWHVATWAFQIAQQGRPLKPPSTYGYCEGNWNAAIALNASNKACFDIGVSLLDRSCQSITVIRYSMQQLHPMQLIPDRCYTDSVHSEWPSELIESFYAIVPLPWHNVTTHIDCSSPPALDCNDSSMASQQVLV